VLVGDAVDPFIGLFDLSISIMTAECSLDGAEKGKEICREFAQ
jgi:hypothetical protein